ncbi:ribosome-associated protein [Anaerobacterium chartisolvens]|uniref:Ribosome-associated protein n=1 Tax=Anaerobacterium chartisolvens TaxID=1297424 RepID=A0A369B3Q0_9FIRM|nr:S4 domain-containing protein YaaA [Anaerobacterium chartisolvens]RCX16133.1 ribosome-associated protein [Anaerobacterium chartisolvens]
MEKIEITTDYIKLDQFLKWVGAAQTGADAKAFINNGAVRVNNEIEMQRGKKLRKEDVIEIGSNKFIIV